jgi:hypothetical protein
MTQIQNTDTKFWWGCGAKRFSIHFLAGMGNGVATLEANLVVSYKTKYTLAI